MNFIRVKLDFNGDILQFPLVSNESSIDVKSLIEPLIERASATANLQSRLWKGHSCWPDWTKKERSKVLNPNQINSDCEAMLDQGEKELKWYTQWHKDALKKGEYDWDKYGNKEKRRNK